MFVGRPQEEGIKQCSSKFFLSMKPRLLNPGGVVALQKVVGGGIWHGATPGNLATDVEPAHNTMKLLCPNETGRLSIFPACCNKGLNVWCEK